MCFFWRRLKLTSHLQWCLQQLRCSWDLRLIVALSPRAFLQPMWGSRKSMGSMKIQTFSVICDKNFRFFSDFASYYVFNKSAYQSLTIAVVEIMQFLFYFKRFKVSLILISILSSSLYLAPICRYAICYHLVVK